MKLSVIILTRNEEVNIEDCIKSVSFADEILVIDSGSTDKTCVLAEALGARVVTHPMDETGFAGQRNFALSKTQAEWVLYLDADERITEPLKDEILEAVGKGKKIAGSIKRVSVVMNQPMHYGVYRPDRVLRLFPREAVCWEGVVHEHPNTKLPVVKLKTPAYHYADRTWAQYFGKFNQYTTLMAQKMHEKGKRTSFLGAFLHAIYSFFQMYVIKRGFLDGRMGFLLCCYHFFYTLTKYVKLMERENQAEGDKE